MRALFFLPYKSDSHNILRIDLSWNVIYLLFILNSTMKQASCILSANSNRICFIWRIGKQCMIPQACGGESGWHMKGPRAFKNLFLKFLSLPVSDLPRSACVYRGIDSFKRGQRTGFKFRSHPLGSFPQFLVLDRHSFLPRPHYGHSLLFSCHSLVPWSHAV